MNSSSSVIITFYACCTPRRDVQIDFRNVVTYITSALTSTAASDSFVLCLLCAKKKKPILVFNRSDEGTAYDTYKYAYIDFTSMCFSFFFPLTWDTVFKRFPSFVRSNRSFVCYSNGRLMQIAFRRKAF